MQLIGRLINPMEFAKRLSSLRKARKLTAAGRPEKVGVHVVQIRRYEGKTSQPSLEIVKKLAVALSVSADELLFDSQERGPDDELRLQFEAICSFDAEEKKLVKAVLDSLILKHEARRWSSPA